MDETGKNAACTPKLKNTLILLEKLKRKFIYKTKCKSKDNIKMKLTNQWITSVRGFQISPTR